MFRDAPEPPLVVAAARAPLDADSTMQNSLPHQVSQRSLRPAAHMLCKSGHAEHRQSVTISLIGWSVTAQLVPCSTHTHCVIQVILSSEGRTVTGHFNGENSWLQPVFQDCFSLRPAVCRRCELIQCNLQRPPQRCWTYP